jgi:tRNA-dihydrouridine synthase
VNGDVRAAQDAARAIAETGCAGVMVGRRAIEHPWIFREARELLDHGREIPGPTPLDRIAICRTHLRANVAQRGEPWGVHCTRRHLAGYLKGIPGAAALRNRLNGCESLDGCLAILDEAEARVLRGSHAADELAESMPGAAIAARAHDVTRASHSA